MSGFQGPTMPEAATKPTPAAAITAPLPPPPAPPAQSQPHQQLPSQPLSHPPSHPPSHPRPALSAGSRPYRSHKVRACDFCRKRKSRCTVDIPGQACLLCRLQDLDCHYGEDRSGSRSSVSLSAAASIARPSQSPATSPRLQSIGGTAGGATAVPPANASRKRRYDDATISPSTGAVARRRLEGQDADSETGRHGLENSFSESVQIVGPVAAEDVHVIERYLPSSQIAKPFANSKAPFQVYSNDPRKPVLYTTISRRRQGLRSNTIFGENQKEILEQILGPFCPDLVRMFLSRINESFPIFDENQLLESYERGTVPPPLLCQVYAMSLVYWNHSHVLAAHPKPDIRYAVNLAVAALHEEFSAAGLSTVGAALIDLTGRPIFSMTGNAINSGRVVALAHCLGLNRDPRNWRLSQSEKNNRIRLWWGVVIHDRWASYGHGVPPHISRNQYDVPLPTIDVLVPPQNSTPEKVQKAQCFIELCRLTEFLGELLPLVYNLQPGPQEEATKLLRRVMAGLDVWEDSLPPWLKPSKADPDHPVSGSSSLHLGFLALKMLNARLEYQGLSNTDDAESPTARRWFQTGCRRAAEEIVTFITALKQPHFREFWLPYSAYHLTSAATLLVRCAFETPEPEIARLCLSKVDLLRETLQATRKRNDWDLADMCIDHCDKILSKHPGFNNSNGSGNASAVDVAQQQVNGGTGGNGAGTANTTTTNNMGATDAGSTPLPPGQDSAAPALLDPVPAMVYPETLMHNEIVDDMMSISGTFGSMNGLPFDMTGIWGIPGLQGTNPF